MSTKEFNNVTTNNILYIYNNNFSQYKFSFYARNYIYVF